MAEKTNNRLTGMLLSKSRRAQYVKVFAVLAVCIAAAVGFALRYNGVAMTHEEQVLACPVAERIAEANANGETPPSVAHTHGEGCYDEDGNLVCPLEEVTLHTHGEGCYDEDGNLVCTLEERELHTHDDSCYTTERRLTCGLEEGEGHTHTDECYETERKLTCGKEEITEEHVHGPGCFETVIVENDEVDDDSGEADEGAGDSAEDAEKDAEKADEKDAEKADEKDADKADEKDADKAEADDKAKSDEKDADKADEKDADKAKTDEKDTDADKADDKAKSDDKADDKAKDADKDADDKAKDANKADDKAKSDEKDADADKAKEAESLPAQSFEQAVTNAKGEEVLRVKVEAPEGAFPEGTKMEVTTVKPSEVSDAVSEAMSEAGDKRDVDSMEAVDIVFRDAKGKEVEPRLPITVSMTSDKISDEATSPVLVHVDDEGKGEVVDQLSDKQAAEHKVETGDDTLAFDSDAFSVYVIAYTVDFHWEVDGKKYDFSIPGGGFVSFTDLIEILGIAEGTNSEGNAANSEQLTGEDALTLNGIKISDATEKFVADVENVVFSDPDLVWVGKTESDSTVGDLKKANGLDVQYSAGLTDEQIKEINAQTVKGGEWALISKLPFLSDESLTVTMKNGDEFTIRVTDAQISTHMITADGKTYRITVTYDDDAEIPSGSNLEAEEILSDSEQYEGLLSDSAAALGMQKDDFDNIRFFNITIRNGKEVVEPKKAVTVEVYYEDPVDCDGAQDFDVIHFGSEGTEVLTPEVKVNKKDQTAQEFVFQTESFSTFGITVTPTAVSQLVGNKYVIYLNNSAAVLSPESQNNNNRLRAIAVTSDGTNISVENQDTLPVWEIENGQHDNTYKLSTTYNNQKVYLRLEGKNNDGRVWVNGKSQDLRIIRVYNNGEVRFRIAYYDDKNPNDNNPQSLDLDYGIPANGFHTYAGGDNNANEMFSLYEIGEPVQGKVTVHFVDRNGNALNDVQYTGANDSVTKKNDGTFTILNDWNGTSGEISLENDFELSGYTYANTHLAKNTDVEWPEATYDYTLDGIIIEPTLNSTGHALQYRAENGGNVTDQGGNESNRWYDFSEVFTAYIAPDGATEKEYASAGNKDVYVIMDPNPAIGSMTSSGSDDGAGNNSLSNTDPVFHKDLVNNGDGTYELSLSVVGKRLNVSETPKVNVLMVVDTSSSMVNSQNNVNYVNDAGVEVNGTRLAATQVQLRKLGRQLLGMNATSPNSVEVAMVTFDGGVYPDTLDWTSNYDTYNSAVTGLTTHKGTDWEDALDAALEKAQDKKKLESDEPMYVLFFTDGEPSQFRNFHAPSDTAHPNGYKYFFAMYGKEASKDEARAIASVSGIQLYTVFAFGPSGPGQRTYYGKTQFDLLHDLAKYAYNTEVSVENKYAYNATNQSKLEDAFKSILREVRSSLGVSDVVMEDSFTELTVAGVNKAIGDSSGGFRYWKIPPGGRREDKVEWPDAPAATIDESGSVKWDLHEVALENDWTYLVTFTVWPSQDAYDWVADLKNGIRKWEDVPENLKNKVLFRVGNETTGYTYEVQTNPQSSVSNDGTSSTNGVSYTKTTTETVDEKGNDEGETSTYNQSAPGTYVKKTISYTKNVDGTWTKKVVSEVLTAFNMPDKRMDLTNTDFFVEKFWDINNNYTDLHNFLYHRDDNTNTCVSSEKKINFKISKGYNDEGNPIPYKDLELGWQDDENKYDWADDQVYYDGHYIGTIWREKLDISFGLMLTEERFNERGLDNADNSYLKTNYDGEDYYLLKGDYGWDYAIDEINGLNYKFDSRSSVYHPMLINGKPAHVKFTVEDGVWTITEMKKDLTALRGKNILRGDLIIQKELLNIDGNKVTDNPNTTFDFTINLTNNDYVFIPDKGVETVPWYGVSRTTEENGQPVTQYYYYQKLNTNGEFERYATEVEATTVTPDGSRIVNSGYAGNIMLPAGDSKTVTYNERECTGYKEATATLHVKAGEKWSIANIPVDTVVTVSEQNEIGYDFGGARLSNSGGENQVIATSQSENGNTTAGIKIPAGEESTITITNQEAQFDLVISKAARINNEDVLLGGAQFNLMKWDGSTWAAVSAVTNPFTVPKDGGYKIEGIESGRYCLQETKAPDGYIVTQNTYFKVEGRQVTICDEHGNTTTGSGEGTTPYVNEMATIVPSDTGNQTTLKVYNTPGAPLPNTGGSGTKVFTILGSILIVGASSLLVMKRRRAID